MQGQGSSQRQPPRVVSQPPNFGLWVSDWFRVSDFGFEFSVFGFRGSRFGFRAPGIVCVDSAGLARALALHDVDHALCVQLLDLLPRHQKRHKKRELSKNVTKNENCSRHRNRELSTDLVRPYTSNTTPYRVTSLIRNKPTLGHYSRPVPRALLWF